MSSTANHLSKQLEASGYPLPQTEYRFDTIRRWRFDLCWPGIRLAAEIEGGTWANGRHSRGKGYENDCIKYNTATIQGWRVLRFTTAMVEDGRALATIEEALLKVNMR